MWEGGRKSLEGLQGGKARDPVPRGLQARLSWEGGERGCEPNHRRLGSWVGAWLEGGSGPLQDWLPVLEQVQGEVPRLEGGRSHGNRRIPSVASDNLPCASGSVAPPPRCQATPAEFVVMPGAECAGSADCDARELQGAGKPAFSPEALAFLDSSCLVPPRLIPSWMTLNQN